MQGAHDWYKTLGKTYNDLGYKTSRADPCVRFKTEDRNYMIMDTYTDDIFGASNNNKEAKQRKEELGKVWEILNFTLPHLVRTDSTQSPSCPCGVLA